MTTYLDLLPSDIYEHILQHKAAIRIQEQAFKLFYKRYGPSWKNILKDPTPTPTPTLVYDLDYQCFLYGIVDPWYDYCDDHLYAYHRSKNFT